MEMFLKWCRRSRIIVQPEITRTSLESYQRYSGSSTRRRTANRWQLLGQHSRLAPLKVWFRWLTQRKYIPQDPAAELERRASATKLPNVMNKEEAERVLSQPKIEVPLGIRDRAMLELLYSSGLRRMELLHLKLYDVDQKHGLVTVREGKGKGTWVVPIGERALAWLVCI